jgi:hypothetical protein
MIGLGRLVASNAVIGDGPSAALPAGACVIGKPKIAEQQ